MSDLRVRVYNVRFGDAVLVTIPDEDNGAEVERNILFDFGNALGTEGGQDVVFEPVIDDIIAVLAGKPLDLYVMTHEHLDHVQGLFYASERLQKQLPGVKQAWLTGSADPHYYDEDKHPDARKKKIAALAAYSTVAPRLAATAGRSPLADVLMATNDTSTTSKCIDFLRTLTGAEDLHYVDRTTNLAPLQPAPGSGAVISLWAPEEDTSDYYGSFTTLANTLASAATATPPAADEDEAGVGEAALEPKPLAGIDAGAFYNLLDVRHGNGASTLLQIDRASNNTSVVLCLEWNGWRLLFPGDAEKRSWKTMDREGLIKPVHFLKASHHGSHTGMPPTTPIDILDKLLPVPPPDNRRRRSVVSTYPLTYPGVPDDPTLTELRLRTDLQATTDLPSNKLYIDVTFPAQP